MDRIARQVDVAQAEIGGEYWAPGALKVENNVANEPKYSNTEMFGISFYPCACGEQRSRISSH